MAALTIHSIIDIKSSLGPKKERKTKGVYQGALPVCWTVELYWFASL